MKNLAREIEQTHVSEGSVALWWLAQAGFAFKSHAGTVVYLDPYLSDVVERAFGFKRLSLSPMDADDVRADWLVSSHEHLDHLDTDALPIIARNNPRCRFAGPLSCASDHAKCGISQDRQLLMCPGGAYDMGGMTAYTAKADHGELSPDALSLLLDFGEVSVLFTGDTALRVDWMQPLLSRKPDVLIPCINGTFGNMNHSDAAVLTAIVQPRMVIPCHFWMFKEQNGNPEAFALACADRCPSVQSIFLCPGEGLAVTRSAVDRILQL